MTMALILLNHRRVTPVAGYKIIALGREKLRTGLQCRICNVLYLFSTEGGSIQ